MPATPHRTTPAFVQGDCCRTTAGRPWSRARTPLPISALALPQFLLPRALSHRTTAGRMTLLPIPAPTATSAMRAIGQIRSARSRRPHWLGWLGRQHPCRWTRLRVRAARSWTLLPSPRTLPLRHRARPSSRHGWLSAPLSFRPRPPLRRRRGRSARWPVHGRVRLPWRLRRRRQPPRRGARAWRRRWGCRPWDLSITRPPTRAGRWPRLAPWAARRFPGRRPRRRHHRGSATRGARPTARRSGAGSLRRCPTARSSATSRRPRPPRRGRRPCSHASRCRPHPRRLRPPRRARPARRRRSAPCRDRTTRRRRRRGVGRDATRRRRGCRCSEDRRRCYHKLSPLLLSPFALGGDEFCRTDFWFVWESLLPYVS
mmetsp:Transcript_53191/g.140697  ORF Transcript_53191/g.140697 Transcript_53191/m.140697 type:complete len:372 (-) Transcript_53191:809-1924(-)